MTQLPNESDAVSARVQAMNIIAVQKSLPKKLSHLKEAMKIQFILACLQTYRANSNFSKVDFDGSVYDGHQWQIQFSTSAEPTTVPELVEQVMSKWYFSNLSKGENVYFYRFINIFRVNLSPQEWQDTVMHLSQHPDLNLRENILVYQSYREKLDRIDEMLEKRVEAKASERSVQKSGAEH